MKNETSNDKMVGSFIKLQFFKICEILRTDASLILFFFQKIKTNGTLIMKF